MKSRLLTAIRSGWHLRFVLLLLLISACGTFQVGIEYTTPPENTQQPPALFLDDFNDGIADGWTELGPGWGVQNGEYVVSQEGCRKLSRAVAGDPSWEDYAFEVDVMGTVGTDKPISFRYLDANNRYWVTLISRTSWGWGPLVRFGEVENGIETVLRNVGFENQPGIWYHVKVEVLDQRIRIYVDGELVVDYTDTGTALHRGAIALEGWTGDTCEGTVHFDNVRITIP